MKIERLLAFSWGCLLSGILALITIYHLRGNCQTVVLNDLAEHQKFVVQLKHSVGGEDFLTEMTEGKK